MKKAIFSLGLVLCFGIISFAQEGPKPAPAPAAEAKANPNAPEIFFDETSHDFGTLQKGDECSFEFKFKNTGKEPLILANCQASCGCTTPACPKEPIAPGASASIKVKYDSNRVGVFNKTVTVTSNAKNSPVTLTIKGKIDGPAQEEAFPGKNNSGMGQ
ncbi:MAG: DUF1573 domain-containing protein [Bacteroidetes bacterium]|nr:MAG: DUF1573 domain-containing protein [Bacteroidota bacterium]